MQRNLLNYKRLIINLFFAFFAVSLISSYADSLPVPVAEWKLNDGKGNIAKDSSQNPTDGEIHGAKWIEDKECGTSLLFDGVDDYIVIPNSDKFKIKDQITIEALVKPNSRKRGFIMAKEDSWALGIRNGQNKIHMADAKRWISIPYLDFVPEADKIYHIVGVWDHKNSTWKVYVNGQASSPLAVGNKSRNNINISDSPIYIGTWKWDDPKKNAEYNPKYGFAGIISNVKIYNVALNENEIRSAFLRNQATQQNNSYLDIISPDFKTYCSEISPKITVLKKKHDNTTDTNGNDQIILSSSHNKGEFSEKPTPWLPINAIKLKNGRADFYYKDIQSGDAIISVSAKNSDKKTLGISQKNKIISFWGTDFKHFIDNNTLELNLSSAKMPNGELLLDVNVYDSGRNLKSHQRLKASSVNKIDLSRLEPNKYGVEINILDEQNKSIENKDINIIKIKPMKKPEELLEIKDGICFLNQKAYFPIVLWLGTAWDFPETITEEDIKDISSKGFNTIIPGWEFWGESLLPEKKHWEKLLTNSQTKINIMKKVKKLSLRKILDCSQQNNLKVILNLPLIWRTERLNEDIIQIGGKIINSYREHPATLCWLSRDETDEWLKSNAQCYKLYKELDPYRPVYMNYVNAKEVKSNINAFDITSTDPYPIGTESYKIMDVPGNADIIKKTIKDFPKKSFWMTIQMFGSPEEGWSRCPNNAEIRCLAFLALNHGAKGLSFYNYYPEARRKIYSGRGISNELWDYMKELNHQIKTMSLPYLLGKDIENISSNSKELDIKAKSYNGKIYIIAVNHQDKKIVADISLPEIKTSHFNVKFEQRKTTAKDSKIIDNFAPFQTHIYEAEDLMKNKN